MTIATAIVGGKGYTGAEILRLLYQHQQISIQAICSRSEAGMLVKQALPQLRSVCDKTFVAPTIEILCNYELVIFATPNGVAMEFAAELLTRGVRVIDLAADFRLQNITTWQRWYGTRHTAIQLIPQAVYGLPETQDRSAIANAQLVANPGCYATAIQLALHPLAKTSDCAKQISWNSVIIDGKSGVTGAGRTPGTMGLAAELIDNFHPYAITGHRHSAEVTEQIAKHQPISITFVPHLLPIDRGILVTIYLQTALAMEHIHTVISDYYATEAFVDVLEPNTAPMTKHLRGTNMCQIGVSSQTGDGVIIFSAIDNLGKGAAGQAVQNINCMYGFAENTGLQTIGVMP